MSQTEVSKQSLTPEEKRKLAKTRNVTFVIMVFMLIVTLGIAWGALSVSDAMFYPVLFFLIFFIGVQVFIVVVRIKQSQATEKTIYTGILTEKKSETSRTKNSSLHETYSVKLDEEWFSVEQHQFSKIHQGEKVSLHTVGNKQVIAVESVQETPRHRHQQHRVRFDQPELFSEQTNELENKILNSKILFAVIFRAVIGYFGMRLFLMFLGFFIVMLHIAFESNSARAQVLLAYFASWAIYIWINLKTVKLIIDRITRNTFTTSEQITDRQISNSRKPSQNSVITTRNYSNYIPEFYYLQTSKHWFEVSKELYDSVETGDLINVRRSKLAKVQLDIHKQGKLNYR